MEATIIGYNGVIFCNAFVGGKEFEENQEEVILENLSPALVNNPLEKGQLGFVLDLSKIKINQEAKDLLKTIKPGRDAIGDIDLFQAEMPIVSWLGGPMIMVNPKTAEGSRDYDISILESIETIETEIPQNIKDYFN